MDEETCQILICITEITEILGLYFHCWIRYFMQDETPKAPFVLRYCWIWNSGLSIARLLYWCCNTTNSSCCLILLKCLNTQFMNILWYNSFCEFVAGFIFITWITKVTKYALLFSNITGKSKANELCYILRNFSFFWVTFRNRKESYNISPPLTYIYVIKLTSSRGISSSTGQATW